MAIIACAWMENEWLQTLTDKDKACFAARRFMDDILMVYAKNDRWDHEKFIADFEESTASRATNLGWGRAPVVPLVTVRLAACG